MQKSKKNIDFKKKIEDLMMEKFMDTGKKSRIDHNSSPVLMISTHRQAQKEE